MFQNLLRVLGLVIVMTNSVLSQQTLQYNLKVNDTFTFLQKADQNIVQTINGEKHIIDNTIEGLFTFYVKKVTDSSYLMDFKYDKFIMRTNSNLYGKLLEINTDSIDVYDAQSRIFMALTESSLSMEMLKTGKIVSLKGTDALIKKMIDGAGFENEFTKAMMEESMKSEFGKNKMINSLEQFIYIYPKKAVSKNDTWKNTYSGNYNSANTWQLKNIDKGKITILGTSSVAMDSQNESTHMILKGSSVTSSSSSKDTGIIYNMTVESTMTGTTTLKSMESMELPTTIITKTTYKTLKNVQQNF